MTSGWSNPVAKAAVQNKGAGREMSGVGWPNGLMHLARKALS